MHRTLTLICATVAAGCTEGLDDVTEVTDLRVLAVKATPPEVMLENVFELSGYEVQNEVLFEVLAVDPRGVPVNYRWFNCPVESSKACNDYVTQREESVAISTALAQQLVEASGTPPTLPVDTVGDVLRVSLDNLRDLGTGLAAAEFRSEPDRAVVPLETNAFALPLRVGGAPTPDVTNWLTSLALDGQFGLLQGAWPSVVLEFEAGGQALEVQKRFVVNIGSPRNLSTLLEAFGVTAPGTGALDTTDVLGFSICPPPPNAPPPNCLILEDRQPNENPVITGVDYSMGESADGTFQTLTATQVPQIQPLQVLAEESVRLRPTFTEASFESYTVINVDLQTSTLFTEERVEELSISWFATAGELQDAVTWPLFTRTLDTVITMPDAPPEATNGLITVWLVVQDQRGGTDWTSVELQVCPRVGLCRGS